MTASSKPAPRINRQTILTGLWVGIFFLTGFGFLEADPGQIGFTHEGPRLDEPEGRTHIPGLPTTGHPDAGPRLTISGQVIIQPDSPNESARLSGPRATVLAGGSVVGTTLTGEVLATAATDENGFYSLSVPSNADDVIVSANLENLTLVAAVARIPDDSANIDATTSTVSAFAEEAVGQVGTSLNFDELLDSLEAQVDRPTSLMHQMNGVQQAILDRLVESATSPVRSPEWRNSTLTDSHTAFHQFAQGNFISDPLVEDTVSRLNVSHLSVVALSGMILVSFQASADLEKNRGSLNPEELAQIEDSFRIGLRASAVNDHVDDAVVTGCFFGYIRGTMGELLNQSVIPVRQGQIHNLESLNALRTISENFNGAVNSSQEVQTLLSQQYNAVNMLTDYTIANARALLDQGIGDQETAEALEDLTFQVFADTLAGTGGIANAILDVALSSYSAALATTGMAQETVSATIQNLEADLRPIAEANDEKAQNQVGG